MMKMLTRGVAVKFCRSLYKQSTNLSKELLKNKGSGSGSGSGPPLLLNCGDGYFDMLTSTFLRGTFYADDDPVVAVKFPYKNFVVTGPCKGLFCLYSVDGQIALWNPGTGDVKDLSSEENVPVDEEIEIHNLGVGFDTNNNDYKIVRFITRSFVNPYYRSVDLVIRQMEIYSLKMKKWTEIPVVEEIISNLLPSILFPALFVDGACYWTVPGQVDDEFKRLVSFDFADEEFHLHCLPQSANSGFCGFATFNLNGCPLWLYLLLCYGKM